jgi:hypothetical protein
MVAEVIDAVMDLFSSLEDLFPFIGIAIVAILVDHKVRAVQNQTIIEHENIMQQVCEVALSLKHGSENGQAPPPRKKRKYVRYKRERAKQAVREDYMGPTPIFDDCQFECVFRVTRTMAQAILEEVASMNPFFTQTSDALNCPGICPQVKLLMGLKVMAYGVSPSAFQDYFQMGEATGLLCVKSLASAICSSATFQQQYFRPMNRVDARRVSQLHEE